MSEQAVEARSLNSLLRMLVQPFFRRYNADGTPKFNRDIIIGLIGDRGGGKSIGGAQIAIRDHMLDGEPCFSNLNLNVNMTIDEKRAAEYKVVPGTVQYQSQELDMVKFMRFDPIYRGGVYLVDEINIAMADARRAMSSQNLGANDVGQQLRKQKMAFIYTCIKESYVDIRIRDMTDFFIMTKDAAYVSDNMTSGGEGHSFYWSIYPMTDKAAAIMRTYQKYTGGPAPHSRVVPGRAWWDAIDTWEYQTRRKYKASGGAETEATVEESMQLAMAKREIAWVEPIANRLVAEASLRGNKIPCEEVEAWPEVLQYGTSHDELQPLLRDYFNIYTDYARYGGGTGRGTHYMTNRVKYEDMEAELSSAVPATANI